MKIGRRRVSLRAALLWFAVSYSAAIIGYVAVNAFASRLLGPASFGYFVIAMTATTLVGQLTIVGVHRGGLREAARLQPGDDDGLRALRRGVRAVSLIPLPAAGFVTAAVTYVLVDSLPTLARLAVAAGVGLLVVLDGQKRICANHLRGLGQVRFASLLEGRSGGALVAVCQGALIGIILLAFPGVGLAGAVVASAIGYAIPVLVALRRLNDVWGHVSVQGQAFRDLKAVLSRDWRFASNQLAGYLNSVLELWLAGLLLSAVDTSQFSAAQRLSMLLVIPMISLQVVFSPVVSRFVAKDDYRTLEQLLRTGAALAAVGTSVAWLPILIAPEALLKLMFGDGFAAAAPVLLLLTVGNLANVLTGLAGTALMMSHHESVVMSVQWVAVLSRLVVGTAAAAQFGLIGLGASAGAITAAMMIALWVLTRRRMGISTHLTLRPNLRLLRETAG